MVSSFLCAGRWCCHHKRQWWSLVVDKLTIWTPRKLWREITARNLEPYIVDHQEPWQRFCAPINRNSTTALPTVQPTLYLKPRWRTKFEIGFWYSSFALGHNSTEHDRLYKKQVMKDSKQICTLLNKGNCCYTAIYQSAWSWRTIWSWHARGRRWMVLEPTIERRQIKKKSCPIKLHWASTKGPAMQNNNILKYHDQKWKIRQVVHY